MPIKLCAVTHAPGVQERNLLVVETVHLVGGDSPPSLREGPGGRVEGEEEVEEEEEEEERPPSVNTLGDY